MLSATNEINAHAVSYVPVQNPSFIRWGNLWGLKITPPSGCIGIKFDTLATTPPWNHYTIYYPSTSSTVVASGSLGEGNTLSYDFVSGSEYWIGFSYNTTTPQPSSINSVELSWIMPSADTNNYATEQRYYSINWGSDQFTKSNSLPLIYSTEHYLSEFVQEGGCNSIQVDASTVGGDALEWRLNLGQSGIDGQTAWLPIGYKMPVEVGSFDLHSVQLRMKDPSDPTQYYPLSPEELSLCTVTYGYTADVVLQLPRGEYQELPTAEMPTIEEYQMPTMPNVAEYVSTPVSLVTTVYNWLVQLPHFAVLLAVLAFAFVVRVIIW